MDIYLSVLVYFALFLGLFTLIYFLLSFAGRKKNISLKSMGTPFVSIIIPAWNEEKSLEKTVLSTINLDYPSNKIEVLIVDDGSKDSTPKIGKELTHRYKNVRYFRKNNGGKGSALNLGIEKAKGEYIATFDADSMVSPNALKLMINHFSDPKVMAVTPAMKVFNPRTISQRIQSIEYDLGIFYRKSFANLNSINVTPGPFSIIKKEFFKKYGGYRSDVLTEDMEMAMRIQSHNYLIANEPRAMVYTIAPRNFFSLIKQRRRWYVGSLAIFEMYKNMFSRKYGDFGLFMLPLALLSVLTTMSVTIYYFIKGIIDSIQNYSHYSSIGFDFLHNFNFQIYFFILDLYNSLNGGFFFFALLFFVFTISLLFVLNRKLGSKENHIRTFINYLIFISTYGILYSLWWGISIIYRLTGRNVKW